MEKAIGPKIPSVLNSVSRKFKDQSIPYALIGAMALGMYGLSRYTSDIDLLADHRHWQAISRSMDQLGFECFQKAGAFAQFDAEGGILGKVDLMLVDTPDGRDILSRRVVVEDDSLGKQAVIQPTDYLVLKMMAIANDTRRRAGDEADIAAVAKLCKADLIPDLFEPLDYERLVRFAERFGMQAVLARCLDG